MVQIHSPRPFFSIRSTEFLDFFAYGVADDFVGGNGGKIKTRTLCKTPQRVRHPTLRLRHPPRPLRQMRPGVPQQAGGAPPKRQDLSVTIEA